MGTSKCEQSPGEKQQGIFSRVMPEGHNYSRISYNKASFPPIKHNPTVPVVCVWLAQRLYLTVGTEDRPRLFSPQARFGHKAELWLLLLRHEVLTVEKARWLWTIRTCLGPQRTKFGILKA